MKLRSHEILSNTKSSSRFKEFFQRKNLFKKKPQSTTSQPSDRIHGIPDYVRKSILRYLLEV
jgi:hypothetical protein